MMDFLTRRRAARQAWWDGLSPDEQAEQLALARKWRKEIAPNDDVQKWRPRWLAENQGSSGESDGGEA